MTLRSARAAPLPAEARRSAIIAATLPLIQAHGRGVTTRQIAQAAGIAEGTIFTVFDDKDALVDAALRLAFDPAPTLLALAQIPSTATLQQRVTEVVTILRLRIDSVSPLFAALGAVKPEGTRVHSRRLSPLSEYLPAMEQVLTCHNEDLRMSAAAAARMLRALVFGSAHPMLLADAKPFSTKEIVNMFLHGVSRQEPSTVVPSSAPSAQRAKPC